MSLLLALLLLTVPEQASANDFLDAARYVGQAEAAAVQPNTLAALNRAQRDVAEGAFGLLGALATVEGKGVPRADQVRAALDRLDRAYYDSVPTALGVAEAAHENLTAYFLASEVLPRLQRVDRTLAYADPTPQGLLPGQTVAAVIGPHGDYYHAIRHLFLGPHYGRDMIDEGLLPKYRATRARPALDAIRAYVYIADREYQAAARVAALTPAADQFCSVLEAARMLTDARDVPNRPDAPEVFLGMLSSIAEMESDPLLKRALLRLGDWWAHNDGADWQLFVFRNAPQKTRCGQ